MLYCTWPKRERLGARATRVKKAENWEPTQTKWLGLFAFSSAEVGRASQGVSTCGDTK